MVTGVLLMLFIYWGWDTSVSINEETADSRRNPGLAAIISTVLLLCTYFIVTLAAQAYAGVGAKGIGLANPAHESDVISVLGTAVFGSAGMGSVLAHLLVLMVLTSAAASTQTTILPTARTTLSMAVYKGSPTPSGDAQAVPDPYRVHPHHGRGVGRAVPGDEPGAKGNLIPDAVTAIGIWIAFYYGLTGFTCAWYYRKVLTRSARDLWMKGILPLLGGLMLYFAMGWSIWRTGTTTTPLPPATRRGASPSRPTRRWAASSSSLSCRP